MGKKIDFISNKEKRLVNGYIQSVTMTKAVVTNMITSGIGYNPIIDVHGHGYIKIKPDAIKEAVQKGDLTNFIGVRKKAVKKADCNKIYEYANRDIALFQVDILNSDYYAFQLMDNNVYAKSAVSSFPAHMVNIDGNNKFKVGRHECLTYIKMKNKETEEKIKAVQTPMMVLRSINEQLPLRGLDIHHINAHWDMRLWSVTALDREYHNKAHKGQNKSWDKHRLDVEINTYGELMAFLDFVESEEYFNLFR